MTFDARHNHPRIGRIVIARGRDAADVAISTTFGRAQLVRFSVLTEQIQCDAISACTLVPQQALIDEIHLAPDA